MATDTKACEIGAGATESATKMFWDLFPDAKRAIVVSDPRTREVAGSRVVGLLEASGVEVVEHVICPDGSWFHATCDKVEEVRDAIRSNARTIPIAVGSGTVNDLVSRLGLMDALIDRLFGKVGVWEV